MPMNSLAAGGYEDMAPSNDYYIPFVPLYCQQNIQPLLGFGYFSLKLGILFPRLYLRHDFVATIILR